MQRNVFKGIFGLCFGCSLTGKWVDREGEMTLRPGSAVHVVAAQPFQLPVVMERKL